MSGGIVVAADGFPFDLYVYTWDGRYVTQIERQEYGITLSSRIFGIGGGDGEVIHIAAGALSGNHVQSLIVLQVINI